MVWSIYRVADAAFLMAAVAMHHMTGEGDWFPITGDTPCQMDIRIWMDGTHSC